MIILFCSTNYYFLVFYVSFTLIFLPCGLLLSITQTQKRKKVLFTLYFSIALIIYCLFIWQSSKYYPSVHFKDKVTFILVTKPLGIDAMYKNSLAYYEYRGDKYVILGWIGKNNLAYTKDDGKAKQTFIYDIMNRRSTKISQIDKLYIEKCSYDQCIKSYEKDSFSERIIEGFVSPDKKHIAVIYKWIFGPEDIIIIAR